MSTASQAGGGGSARRLAGARRVVVKVGSALLVDMDSGRLDRGWLSGLAADVAAMRARGQQVVLVSSGAIALGGRLLGLNPRRSRIEECQAAAAAGQIHLAHAYQELLAAADLRVAQVLLTLDDSENRRRYLNARNTMETLLRLGAVPVVNENDTVATNEIRYGDNDRLAARVAQMVDADCLVLLSDVDGLYTADPNADPTARHVEEVVELTPEVEAMASGAISGVGAGGMRTKLEAARIATAAGCAMVIAPGHVSRPLQALEAGGRCTWFLASDTPGAARKRWIAGTLQPRGRLVVDGGAQRALARGGSLLPAGIVSVRGEFERGDAVVLESEDGREIGRGLCAYSSAEVHRLKGRHSGDIANILGYRGREEIVHRDDLVLAGRQARESGGR